MKSFIFLTILLSKNFQSIVKIKNCKNLRILRNKSLFHYKFNLIKKKKICVAKT